MGDAKKGKGGDFGLLPLQYIPPPRQISDFAVLVKKCMALSAQFSAVSQRNNIFSKLQRSFQSLGRYLHNLHAIFVNVDKLQRQLDRSMIPLDIDVTSLNQIMGRIHTTLMSATTYQTRLGDLHRALQKPKLMAEAWKIEEQVKSHNLRLRYLLEPLELDLLSRAHLRWGVPKANLVGLFIKNLEDASSGYDINKTPLEPLPVPPDLKAFFDQRRTGEVDSDPVSEAHELIERLEEILSTKGSTLSTHQYVRLLNCVYLYGKVRVPLILNEAPGPSHWPAFLGAIKNKLDFRCGWQDNSLKEPLQIPNVSYMTPLVLKLATMRPDAYHELPAEDMPDMSQAGVVTNDSGYESLDSHESYESLDSHESSDEANEFVHVTLPTIEVENEDEEQEDDSLSDIVSTYSVGMPDPQYGGLYIEEFSRRLIEDMRGQLEFESALGPDLTEQLPFLIQRFGRRLHSEAVDRSEREAAVFLRRNRWNIIHCLGSGFASKPIEYIDDKQDDHGEEDQIEIRRKSKSEIVKWLNSLPYSFEDPNSLPKPESLQDPNSSLDFNSVPISSPKLTAANAVEPRTNADISSNVKAAPLFQKHEPPLRTLVQSSFDVELELGAEAISIDESEPEDTAGQTRRLPNIVEYEKFVKSSSAYQWLLSMVKRYCQMRMPQKLDALTDIRVLMTQLVLSRRVFRKVSRETNPPGIRVNVSLNWNLRDFIKEQGYNIRPDEVLHRAICVTGTWSEAHATTPLDYMKQTWPLSYKPLYGLLKGFLTSETDSSRYDDEMNQHLSCDQHQSDFQVTLRGSLDFVLEALEQLAWVSSGLRPSCVNEGVRTCYPRLQNIEVDEKDEGTLDCGMTLSCQIEFAFQEPPEQQHDSTLSTGSCWFNLFRNAVIVTGYPIPWRSEVGTGLEVPLSFMSLVVDSGTIFKMNENIMLKGFSTLLIATRATVDMVIWHLIFNAAGGRISYFDDRLKALDRSGMRDTSLKDLETRRHIVGWCRNITEYSGHRDANWSISSSDLGRLSKSHVIDRAYIEGGSYAIAGIAGSIGKQHRPARLVSGTYDKRIALLCSRPTLFYDVEDKRGWLIDGATALLHLARASIHRDSENLVFKQNWKFSGELESGGQGQNNAAEILTNEKNQNQPLFLHSKTTEDGQMEKKPYLFHERVQQILTNFEFLIDYDTDVAFRDGYWIQPTKGIKSTVQGFDFWDLANAERTTPRRAHELQSVGYGWTDYIRFISATTLFGKKFGELLKVTSPDDLCRDWRSVPVGAECLAVSVSTLKALHLSGPKPSLPPGELTREITWSSRMELFLPCSCVATVARAPPAMTSGVQEHSQHNPIQVLLPKSRWKMALDIPNLHSRVSLHELESTGAVLFGHTPYRIIGNSLGDESDRHANSTAAQPSAVQNQAAQPVPGQSSTHSPVPVQIPVSASPTTTSIPAAASSNRPAKSKTSKRQWLRDLFHWKNR